MPREIVIFNVRRMIFFTSNPLSSGLNYDKLRYLCFSIALFYRNPSVNSLKNERYSHQEYF